MNTSNLATMRARLNSKLKIARSQGCFQKPHECKVLWSEIEEMSSTISRKKSTFSFKSHEKTDLDAFCEEYPWDDYFIYAS